MGQNGSVLKRLRIELKQKIETNDVSPNIEYKYSNSKKGWANSAATENKFYTMFVNFMLVSFENVNLLETIT